MKTYQKLLFLALMYQVAPSTLGAQTGIPLKTSIADKPYTFARLPQQFECDRSVLRRIFLAKPEEPVTIPLTNGQYFKGTVQAKVQQEADVLSINIQSSNYPGSMLSLSLISLPDGTEKMIGRILNPGSGDVLTIQQIGDKFLISRELQKFVMTDCPLPSTIEKDAESL
jgi:hypothetical protein